MFNFSVLISYNTYIFLCILNILNYIIYILKHFSFNKYIKKEKKIEFVSYSFFYLKKFLEFLTWVIEQPF